jgi:signal transduction histidine kinase
VILLGLLPWLVVRSWVERGQLLRAAERTALAEAERLRMSIAAGRTADRRHAAERIHDGLGHDLSLVALRASAL